MNSAFFRRRLVGGIKVAQSKPQSGYSSGDSSKSSPSSDKQLSRTNEPSLKQDLKNAACVVERNRNDVVTSNGSSNNGKDGAGSGGGDGGSGKHVFSDSHHQVCGT